MRVCRICGASLAGRRRQTVYCDGPCRAEASRLRAILSGNPSAPYKSLAERFEVARNRTSDFWQPPDTRPWRPLKDD